MSRSRLLATVSAVALVIALQSEPSLAKSASGEPTLWIDLGWHTESLHESKPGYVLPFDSLIPSSGITGPLAGALNLSNSQGDDAKISFRPDRTDWVFSASVRYGRSHGKGRLSQFQHLPTTSFTTYHTTIPTYPFPYHRTNTKPAHETANKLNADTISAETHYIVDFEAGKDVGLGLFGRGSTSTLSAGVRFANFTTALNVKQFHGIPDVHISYTQTVRPTNAFFPSTTLVVPWYHTKGRQKWHDLAGNPHSSHDFIGIGPTISWEASAPLWGDVQRDGLSLDWSVNAALLFGKQKNKTHHQTIITAQCYGRGSFVGSHYVPCAAGSPYQNTSTTRTSRNVTVPNLGGSIGISYRLHDVKLNAGYRADYFFRAMATGLAGQNAVTRSFRGPYASVSIGIP